MTLLAITRAVSSSLARCELTHLARSPIDIEAARRQHHAYEQALVSLGVQILRPPGPDLADELPDAVFVEDTAVVLDEVAVVTRPGAPSRRAETAAIASILRRYRPIVEIHAPGTLDGGDVLRLGRTLYVGNSSRTNAEGIRQLRAAVEPWKYQVRPVEVKGCLHLKSAVTTVGENLLLTNSRWLGNEHFGGAQRIEVDEGEEMGANALAINATIVYSSAFPRTRERLERHNLRVLPIDCTEIAKAEGAVTCCSLLFTHE
jgi:dimethylargininase